MNQLIDSLALVVTPANWLGLLVDIWLHCVKSVQIRSFFSVFFHIQSHYRKGRTQKARHLDIFHAMLGLIVQLKFSKRQMKKSN